MLIPRAGSSSRIPILKSSLWMRGLTTIPLSASNRSGRMILGYTCFEVPLVAQPLLTRPSLMLATIFCVIADADDVSHPSRLELTLRHFHAEPSRTISAFASFNEESAFETPHPNAPLSVGLQARSLFGKPAFLGTLAFRKSQFATPFDTSMASGFDHKWMHENICLGRRDGIVIPLNHVYRGRRKARDPITPTDIELIYSRHTELLGQLTERQKQLCRLLVGYEAKPDATRSRELKRYVVQLIVRNAEKSIYRPADIEQLLLLRLNELETEMLRMFSDKYARRIETLKRASARTRRVRKLMSLFSFTWPVGRNS